MHQKIWGHIPKSYSNPNMVDGVSGNWRPLLGVYIPEIIVFLGLFLGALFMKTPIWTIHPFQGSLSPSQLSSSRLESTEPSESRAPLKGDLRFPLGVWGCFLG